jgi:hypothetical protein
VIATFEGPLDLADYKDEYREGLQRIIDAKIAGEEIVAPTVEAPPRVVNLMDALKKSLDAVLCENPAQGGSSENPPIDLSEKAFVPGIPDLSDGVGCPKVVPVESRLLLGQAAAMHPLPPPLAFLLLLFSGWVNRQQQAAVDYLLEENRIPAR